MKFFNFLNVSYIHVHAGSVVVQGTYFKQVKIVQHGIHFTEYQIDNKVYQYSHLVIVVGLILQTVPRRGRSQKWRLDSEDHDKILSVIEERCEPLDVV